MQLQRRRSRVKCDTGLSWAAMLNRGRRTQGSARAPTPSRPSANRAELDCYTRECSYTIGVTQRCTRSCCYLGCEGLLRQCATTRLGAGWHPAQHTEPGPTHGTKRYGYHMREDIYLMYHAWFVRLANGRKARPIQGYRPRKRATSLIMRCRARGWQPGTDPGGPNSLG